MADDINSIPQFEANDAGYTAFSAAVMNLLVDAINRNSAINSTKDEFIRVTRSDADIKISFNKDALDKEIKKLIPPSFRSGGSSNEQICQCRYY